MNWFRLAASIAAEEAGSFANNASTASAAAIPSGEEDINEEEEMILVSLYHVVSWLVSAHVHFLTYVLSILDSLTWFHSQPSMLKLIQLY